jgi:hypothetical protein
MVVVPPIVAIPIAKVVPVVLPPVADIADVIVPPILPLAQIADAARQVLNAIAGTSGPTEIGAPWLPDIWSSWSTDVTRPVAGRAGPTDISRTISRSAGPTNIGGTISKCTRSANVSTSAGTDATIADSTRIGRERTRNIAQARSTAGARKCVTWTITQELRSGATSERAAGPDRRVS